MNEEPIPQQAGLSSAMAAGAIYTAVVFAIGFGLGTVRIFVLVPWVGERAAVLLEGPIILSASWVVCRILIRRYSVPSWVSSRLLMGAVAFVLLMIAELLLSLLMFGHTFAEHIAHYQKSAGIIGLLGQVLFSLFPLLQLFLDRGREGGARENRA